jgi:hypothetical protein
MKKSLAPLAILAFAACFSIATAQPDAAPCQSSKLMQFEDAAVYSYMYLRSGPDFTSGDSALAIIFKNNLNIDADGSPRAYGPNNSGLDWTANAGKPGDWWALITDNGDKAGNPITQGADDPAPGMYVCATSLYDKNFKTSDPRRYVNSEVVPYISLPKPVRDKAGVGIGDFVWVYNTQSQKGAYAIYADAGGNKGIGEGSMWLAEAIGLKSNPRKGGGTSDNIILFVVLPKTSFGQGVIPSSIQIHQKGLLLLGPEETDKIANCSF